MLSSNVLLAADLVRKLAGVRALQKGWGDGIRFKSPACFTSISLGFDSGFPGEVDFNMAEIKPALKAVEDRLIAELKQIGVACP